MNHYTISNTVRNNNREKISEWLDLIQDGLNPGKIVELPVLSGSMMPILIPGNKIKIQDIPVKDITIGDIIIFKEGISLTAHRVLFKIPLLKSILFYQKGDKNRFGGWIKERNIIGIVSHVQNISMNYIDLTSELEKKQARYITYKHIIHLLMNLILIYPRKIKNCITGINPNSD